MTKDTHKLATKVIHAGEPTPRIDGSVIMPIFQSAMFEYQGGEGYHDIRYLRLNNTPNHVVIHNKLAALEQGEAAIVTASGMAAISTALLAVMQAGDHLLAQNCLYGGTHNLLTDDFAQMGLSYDFINADVPVQWAAQLKSNTKAIYVESITNPLTQVADLKAIVEFARANNLISIIDNTFASPVNFRAAEFGFDLVIHSCTKYLNGHSDIVAGAVIGKAHLIAQVVRKLNHFGGSLDPHAIFLLHRGIKTLALRVKHQNSSALQIAQFLAQHPAVAQVHYPGLETHPHHQRAAELFEGFGGMISFELKGGLTAANQFLAALTIPVKAPSLGGVESLISRPAATSHVGINAEERMALGITEGLMRLSVGIEDTQDIIADFQQALAGLS